MGLRLSATLAAFAMLAGCTVAPLPELKPPLPTAWRNAPAAAAAPRPDLRDWWRAFDDPALDALVERALQNNPGVAEAAERLRAERMLYPHAHGAYMPTLEAGTNDVINPDTSASYFVVGFDATWELPLFGAWQSASRLAQGNLDAAAADWQGARVSLVAEVVRRWIELRAAQHQERLLAAVLAADREKLRLLQVQQRLQLAAPDQIDAATAVCDEDEAALAAPRRRIDASAQQLAVLLGQPEPDPSWLQAGPEPQLGQWQLDSVPADLLRTQPQIARAQADVLHAAGELGISRADIYPHIGLGTALQWSVRIADNHRARTGESIFSLGPIINIPLFDWGQRVARAHANDHELKAAVYAYRQAVLQGVADTETALGDLHQLRGRVLAMEHAVQALDQATAVVRKRDALGLDSTLQVLDSTVRQRRAQIDLASARAERDLAYVALYKALGGAPLPAADLPPAGRRVDARDASP